MQLTMAKVGTAVLMGALGLTTAQRLASAEEEHEGHRLQGTWELRISLVDCATGAPVGNPFVSLLTFNQGGTVTETTANPSFYPAVRGPGHGVWQKTEGRGSYTAVTRAYITVNGVLARIQTITQKIELLTPDTLKTTSAQVKFTAPDGTPAGGGCAAATGTRVEIEAEP